MSTKTNPAAEAVRNLVEYVRDRDSIIDHDLIAELNVKREEATDPLVELEIINQIFQAEHPDVSALEDAFVDAAPVYAEENDLADPVGSFKAIGVPNSLVRRAFPDLVKGGGGSGGPRVTQDDVRNYIPEEGEFTINDIVTATGASRGTVVKVIEEMAEAVGDDPTHEGRGKAPTLYRRVG